LNLRTRIRPAVDRLGSICGVKIVPREVFADGRDAQLLERICGEVRTIFDVGANVGETVDEYRKAFPAADIHAFEPDPTAMEKLRSRSSRMSGITLSDRIVSDHDGEVTFVTTELNNLSHVAHAGEGGRTYPCLALDTYCEQTGITEIDVLKVDTEGHDLKVLDGARSLLDARRVKTICVEYGFAHNGLLHLEDLVDYLFARDFTLYMTFDHWIWNGVLDHGNALFVRRDLAPPREPPS
jgi:FkbM family methyltransferase